MAFYDTDYNQIIRQSGGGGVVQDAQQKYNHFVTNAGAYLGNPSMQQGADAAKRILDLYNFAVQNGFKADNIKGISKLHGQIYEQMITDFLAEKNLLQEAESQAGFVNSAKAKGYAGTDFAEAFNYLDSWNSAAAVAREAGLDVKNTTTLDEIQQFAAANQAKFNQEAQLGQFNNAGDSTLAFKEYENSNEPRKFMGQGGQTGTTFTKVNGILYENGQPVQDQAKLQQYYNSVPEGGSIAVGGGTPATGQNGASGGTLGGGSTAGFTPTGNPVLDQTLQQLQTYLQELEKKGQVVNPNITLDAKTLAEFTKQAEAEIDPYYSTQLKAARESLLNSAGFSRDEVLRNEQQLERQYQTQFRQLGEGAAEQGFALSGARQRDEQTLATDTQNTINSNRRNLEFSLGNTARQFAQTYGTSNLPSVDIGAAPSITGGERGFTQGQGSRSLYQLDPNVYSGLVGSQEFERRGAIRNRSSQLEEAFRANAGLTQQRSLVL